MKITLYIDKEEAEALDDLIEQGAHSEQNGSGSLSSAQSSAIALWTSAYTNATEG